VWQRIILSSLTVVLAIAAFSHADDVVVRNDSPDRIIFRIKASSNRRWTSVEVPAGASRRVDLVSRDTFDLRIWWYASSRRVEDFGADDVDLHAAASLGERAPRVIRFLHWTTWLYPERGPTQQLRYSPPSIQEFELSSNGKTATIRFPKLVGHKNPQPIIRP
jgi:hypothetical protein